MKNPQNLHEESIAVFAVVPSEEYGTEEENNSEAIREETDFSYDGDGDEYVQKRRKTDIY